ncbi:MAG: PTS sugar transporter subunit IIC [Deltaproteobacteria bacterium]|nr:PTS sugar transporter subunit IIC [Deltaproteobacteria bacterium]
MVFQFLLAVVIGAIAYLDRTAAFQVMLHRPLVVATAMGAVFGNVYAGAQVGAIMELLYLARLPVGASIPPDDTGAAMFGGAAAAVAASSVGLSAGSFTAVLLLSVPCAELGKAADRLVRRVNGRIAALTAESVDRGDSRSVEHGLLAGVTLFALSGAVLSLAFTGAGVAVGKLTMGMVFAATFFYRWVG